MATIDAHRKEDVGFRSWRRYLKAQALLTRRNELYLRNKAGLPFTWYDVLFQLAETDEHLRMNELAEAVFLTRSGLSRSVDQIEAAGLIARQTANDDRRRLNVELTDAGRKKLALATLLVTMAVRDLLKNNGLGTAGSTADFDRQIRGISSRVSRTQSPPGRQMRRGDRRRAR